MNAAGYDAAAPGNHEFDYKMEALEANAAAAEFPILPPTSSTPRAGSRLWRPRDL